MKLWGGRFRESLDSEARAFSFSFHIDRRLFVYDVRVNMAHTKALNKAGVLSDSESNQLVACLTSLLSRYDRHDATLFGDDEDVHSCVERLVTESLGDLGKKMHTGKSRNDQVVTDVRLFVKDQARVIIKAVDGVLKSLWMLADAHQQVIFPGFTHFQPAQPVLLAHHFLAYFEQFSRDRARFEGVLGSADVCPLGSGALAGNNYGLDRLFIAQELGFASVTRNSMDAVSDRDFLLELCSASSIAMTHMSRLCEELILWSSPLLGFVTIGDAFTTGSSLMPQKKNPDIAELIRGKSGRVLGHFTALQHIIKALPLTYNRDLQEDKEILFDVSDTVLDSLNCLSKMLTTLKFNTEAIDASLKKGYLLATDFADYLVKKGVPFRQAHDITGAVVLYAIEQKKNLEDLQIDEFHRFSNRVESDVFDALTLKSAIAKKDLIGGTAFDQVKSQLKRIQETFDW